MSVIRYRAPAHHITETVIGEKTVQGSVHHPELAEFAGIVTREHKDGHADLVIFPPGRAPVHVERAKADKQGVYTTPTPREKTLN